MSDLLTKLFTKKPSTLTLAVVQYERDDFSVGREEQLHWALAAVVSVKNQFDVEAHVWQVMDRHYSTGRAMEWVANHRTDVPLHGTAKCLGGVVIGQIDGKDVGRLTQLIQTTMQPIPKFGGWNCRDWIVEVITRVLIPSGWADPRISSQASLLPALRIAAQASAAARQQYKRPAPYFVAL